MADFLAMLPPGKTLAPGRYGVDGAEPITLRAVPTDACTLVAGRDRGAVVGKAKTVFSTDLADAPRRSEGGGLEFIGTGPGRWLVLALASGLANRLETAFAPEAATFKQGGGLVVLEAEGEATRLALAKLVPVDLDPRVFGLGDAATTTTAHVNITTWLVDDRRWRFALGRSHLSAFLRTFASVAAEFGLVWAGDTSA